MQFSLIPFISSFALTVIFLPLFIGFMRMKHEGQVIRDEGPKWHEKKSGTPTMGGVVFMLAGVISTLWVLIWQKDLNKTAWILIIAFLGYGIIGFLDDGIKLYFKRNLGLRAWQKLLGQIIIAALIITLAFSDHFAFELYIPFAGMVRNSFLFSLFVLFWLVGFSNAVNLSDGLDGLATGLSMVAIAPFVIFAVMTKNIPVAIYAMVIVGALLGFMYFNYHPARIFMGDTGSLALGGLLASLAVLTSQELLLILIGGVFLMETLSVIIQVVSFKTRGKRVFKMAPIHHHFEMLGWTEQQVVISFWFLGFICGIIGIVLGVM